MYKLILFITLLFIISFGGCHHSGSTKGGDPVDPDDPVTPVDPVVHTIEDLKKITGVACDEDFTLLNDITVDEPWDGLCPEGFSGVFDGGDYTITFNDALNGGFIAYLAPDGEVKNLKITATQGVGSIKIDDDDDATYAGALVGYANEDTLIDSCSADVTGDIAASGVDAYAGGLVGFTYGDLTDSYAIIDGSITAGASDGVAQAGGLAGNVGGHANNTFAHISGGITATAGGAGSGSGNAVAGGLVGAGDEISNSFAVVAGDIDATGDGAAISGGIIGQAGYSVIFTFTVVGGNIIASGAPSFAGGAVGDSGDDQGAATVENCVVVAAGDINAANASSDAVGNAVSYPAQTDNYAYRGTHTLDGSATDVAADELNAADWWTSNAGYTAADWRIEDNKIPMPAVYTDLELFDWPAWVQ